MPDTETLTEPLKDAEIIRLTEKCNKQINHLKLQKGTIEKQGIEIAELKGRIETLQTEHLTIPENLHIMTSAESGGKLEFLEIFTIFYEVISTAIKDNSFVDVKYVSKFSKKYVTIDYNRLRTYIERYRSNYSVKNILKLWGNYGLVYEDENGKIEMNYVTGGKSRRSVRINKSAVGSVRECLMTESYTIG